MDALADQEKREQDDLSEVLTFALAYVRKRLLAVSRLLRESVTPVKRHRWLQSLALRMI